MTRRGPAHAFPSAEQELLLRAAVLEGEDALAAWTQWRQRVDFEGIDYASFQFLPLVYRNLRTLAADDPLASKLKGIYRQTWYRNQVRFRALATVLRGLTDAGIETMLLKGAALALGYYDDLALRPMNDCDLLVHPRDRERAIEVIRALGWRPARADVDAPLWASVSEHLEAGPERGLDLHWFVVRSAPRHLDADDGFWQHSQPLRLEGETTRALGPADQLLHTCLHGAYWDPTQSLRWLPDVIEILRKWPAGLDWERLLAQAEKYGGSLVLSDMLSYLDLAFPVQIPQAVLRRLEAMPVSRTARLHYWAVCRGHGAWAGSLPLTLALYASVSHDWPLGVRVLRLSRCLRAGWSLGSHGELLRFLADKTAAGVRRGITQQWRARS